MEEGKKKVGEMGEGKDGAEVERAYTEEGEQESWE